MTDKRNNKMKKITVVVVVSTLIAIIAILALFCIKFAKTTDTDAKIADLEVAVSRLDSLTENDGTIEDINTELKKINDILADLSTEKDLYLTENVLQTLLNTTIPEIEQYISNNITNIDTNTSEIVTLNETVNNLRNTFLDLSIENGALSDTVMKLEAELYALSGDITGLLARISEFEITMQALELSVDELNKLIEVGGTIDQLFEQITAIQNALATLNFAYAIDEDWMESTVSDIYMELITNSLTSLEEKISTMVDSDTLALEINKMMTLINAIDGDDTANEAVMQASEDAKTKLAEATSILEEQIREEIEKLQNQIHSNDTDITDISEKIEQLNGLIDALNLANEGLDGKIADAVEATKTALATAIAELEDKIIEKIEDLQSRIGSNDTDIMDISEKIEQLNGLIDALNLANEGLDGKIADAVEATKTALATAIAELEDKIIEKIENLQSRIGSNDTDITDISEKIEQLNGLIEALKISDATLDGKLSDWIAKAENDLTAIMDRLDAFMNGVQVDLEEMKNHLNQTIVELNEAVKAGDKDLSDKIEALNLALEEVKVVLVTVESIDQSELIQEMELANEAMAAALEALQKNLKDAKEKLDSAIQNGDLALEEKINALNDTLISMKQALELEISLNTATLEDLIAGAETSLREAIDTLIADLERMERELSNAIKAGDSTLSRKIASLDAALSKAIAAYESADVTLKAELNMKIDESTNTLSLAMQVIQQNLEEAKIELSDAIANGDNALENKMDRLNNALTEALDMLNTTTMTNKSELVTKIDEATASMQMAIDAISADLQNTKQELDAKDSQIFTMALIACIVSGIALLICIICIAILISIKKKKTDKRATYPVST